MSPLKARLCAAAAMALALVACFAALFWRKIERVTLDPAAISDYGEAGAAVTLRLPDPPIWLTTRSDVARPHNKSRLVLLEDDRPLAAPHSLHAEIAEKGAGRYSHWGTVSKDGDWLIFSASDSTDPRTNGRKYEAIRELGLNASLRAAMLIAALSMAVGTLLLARDFLYSDLTRFVAWQRQWLLRTGGALSEILPFLANIIRVAPAISGFGLVIAATTLATLYAIITALAAVDNWALPSTAAIVQFPIWAAIAMSEPYSAEIVLWVAGVALIIGWALRSKVTARFDSYLERLLLIVGVPIIFCLLVLSASAQWSGLSRPGDLSGIAIAGLIPFSDANGYWADANDVVKDGTFSAFSARRPLAQVFRTTLVAASGFNYATMVIVQCTALAAAIAFATLSVVRWLGLWAGIAFGALVYVTARDYATTSLTEPIGLFWALIAIPFFIEALRTNSFAHAAVAIAVFSISLTVRMGSMFTLPALLLWVIVSLRKDRINQMRGAALVGLAVLTIVGLNLGAARLYTKDLALVGGNFSYTVCGISIGGIWSDCGRIYEQEIPKAALADEKAMNAFMYRKALENIVANPSVAAVRLADASIAFVKALPSVLTRGYMEAPPIWGSTTPVLIVLACIGLLRAARTMSQAESLFWLLFWSSAIVSAGFVFFDDGKRIMIGIYPLACLFVVRGWRGAGPIPANSLQRPLVMRARTGAAFVGGICLAGLLAPLVAQQFVRPSDYVLRPENSAEDHFVFGGRRVTGVLVVADDQPRLPEAPTLLLSEFVRIIEQSGIEIYQHLVTPSPPQTPFAFIQSPSVVLGEPTTHQFITPPDVLTKPVARWRLRGSPFGQIPGNFDYWLLTNAEPLDQVHDNPSR